MSLFTQEFDALSPAEQAFFAEVVKRLLAEGLVWREEEADRRVFSFLLRHGSLVRDYLGLAGWDLRYEEAVGVFQVVHRDGAHRRRLGRDTTLWLLLLRLLYAEGREARSSKLSVTLTRYPVVTVTELSERYAQYFSGQTVRKKTSLEDALRTLSGLKLIRAGGGGALRLRDADAPIELLPTLEVIIPASAISEVQARLEAFTKKNEAAEED